jgi:hypothetical protein
MAAARLPHDVGERVGKSRHGYWILGQCKKKREHGRRFAICPSIEVAAML